MLLLGLPLLACAPAPDPARCGDGRIDTGEECDNGDANTDTIADECRTDCRLAWCGDGVKDFHESCDDGNNDSGDGCNATCDKEGGATESEPNDSPAQAEPYGGPESGALGTDDRDCYALEVAACTTLTVDVAGSCPDGLITEVFSVDDALVYHHQSDPGSCPSLDLSAAPGPLLEGPATVCLSSAGADITYVLDITAEGDKAPKADTDADGWPDACDGCSDVESSLVAPMVDEDGFIQHFLLYAAETEDGSCLPTGELVAGEADLEPTVGEGWDLWINAGGKVDLNSIYGGELSPDREALAVTWVDGDALPDQVELAWGSDDGSLVWWNGALVGEVDSCQGVSTDAFSAKVSTEPGWNRLTMRIRDQGGGWGLIVRLKDADGTVLADLPVSLDPAGAWRPDQRDLDGDGVPDICNLD